MADKLSQYMMNMMLRSVAWDSEMRLGSLTLSSLRFKIGETEEILSVIADMLDALSSVALTCGEKIDLFVHFSSIYQHNGEIRNLCNSLLVSAFEPVGEFIFGVIYEGKVKDPYCEFFIDENFVQTSTVPVFLLNVSESILECGKIARILGSVLDEPMVVPACDASMLLNGGANTFISGVLASHNVKLDEILRPSIEKSLKLVRNIFFISKSNWFMDFITSGDLEKPVTDISLIKVNSWLRSAIIDNTGELQGQFHTFSLDQINTQNIEESEGVLGIRAFTIDWRTEYPINTIFTESMVFKLQCIFRHLFYCKCVDLKLSALWLDFQASRGDVNSTSLLPSNLLLQEMIHFIKNYLFYLSIDVIETKTASLDIHKHTVFEFSEKFDSILSEIISEFNLTTQVYKLLTKVLSTCALFSAHIRRFLALQTIDDSIAEVAQQERYISMFEKFRDAFQGQMNSLIIQLKLNRNTSSENLIARLDFNEYFSDIMGI